MTLTSTNLSYHLDEIVSAMAYESFYEEPFMCMTLPGIRTSNKRRERSASTGGLTMWDEKTPTVAVTEDSVTQQFEKDFVHTAYGKMVKVERELIDDQEFELLENIADEIGTTAAQTMETKHAVLWNDMFNGTYYKSEDALSICNSAHLNSAGGNSQDNSFTNTLNMSGVETCRLAHRKFTNYRGDKMSIRPRLLVVPIDLEQTAYEITRSLGKPETAENQINFYNGLFDMISWDFLSDTNAWFLVDPKLMKRNLIWYQRVGLEIFGDGDLFAGTRRMGGYMRFSQGVLDWRWVTGNNPS